MTQNTIAYQNYFQNHYGYTFTEKDITRYKQWFLSQWNFLNTKIRLRKSMQILEIGSGFGGFYSFLHPENKKNYIGIEVDGQAVKAANEYFKTDVFKEKFLEDIEQTKSADAVFAFEVLEHLASPFESIKKIHELLQEGGYFCGTSPYPYYKNIMADQTHLFVLHPKNWQRLFLLAGFQSVDIYPMSFSPFLWRIHKNLNIRIPFYIPYKGFIATALILAKK